ncbi:hypothetical protein [Carnobacterium divergens]|uniref:hypothetical protein n=1 Tax=Carnobacterium divergens TaxID=2748 RepID=UPI0039AEEB80
MAKIKSMDGKMVRYPTNQYCKGKLMIVKNICYSLIEDTLHNRYFVVNMNNQIVYLDQFKEEAVVELANHENMTVDFSTVTIDSKNKRTSPHKYHLFNLKNYKKN